MTRGNESERWNRQTPDTDIYSSVMTNSCGRVTNGLDDFKRDRGIDGADVSTFFDHWEAGC